MTFIFLALDNIPFRVIAFGFRYVRQLAKDVDPGRPPVPLYAV